jgi:hypothetical protein
MRFTDCKLARLRNRMTITPRTDKCPTPKHGYVPVDFARGLERENAKMRTALNLIDHTLRPAAKRVRVIGVVFDIIDRAKT